jgi:hypothetical protein
VSDKEEKITHRLTKVLDSTRGDRKTEGEGSSTTDLAEDLDTARIPTEVA